MEGEGENWEQALRTLGWTERNGLFTTTQNGKELVGFAIWRSRRGGSDEGNDVDVDVPSFLSRLKSKLSRCLRGIWV